MSNPMEILPADPSEFDEIVALFKRYGFALQERAWWDWKYFDNPHGRSRPFKIVQDGRIVGAVAVMPQAFTWRGRSLTGIQTVDGLMGKEIRGKHLFNTVMAFLLENRPPGVEEDYFYLSFPSLASSIRAHENAGWHRLADGRVYTFFLSPESLRRARRIAWLRPLLAPFWGLYRSLIFSGRSAETRIEPIERFTEDLIPPLDDNKVHGLRTPEMLNWRVLDNPRDDMRAFALYHRGGFAGCFICKLLGRNLEIVDCLFVDPRPEFLASFLHYLHGLDVADSVDLLVFTNNPSQGLLPRTGFVKRRFSGVMFVHDLGPAFLPDENGMWAVSYLDSDW